MLNNAQHTATIRAIRAIVRKASAAVHNDGPLAALAGVLTDLHGLEVDLMPSDDGDYGQPIHLVQPGTGLEEYDTILGFLFRHDGLRLMGMTDPVHETTGLGVALSRHCAKHRLTVMQVTPPPAIALRYPQITSVRAYPVAVLRDFLLGGR